MLYWQAGRQAHLTSVSYITIGFCAVLSYLQTYKPFVHPVIPIYYGFQSNSQTENQVRGDVASHVQSAQCTLLIHSSTYSLMGFTLFNFTALRRPWAHFIVDTTRWLPCDGLCIMMLIDACISIFRKMPPRFSQCPLFCICKGKVTSTVRRRGVRFSIKLLCWNGSGQLN